MYTHHPRWYWIMLMVTAQGRVAVDMHNGHSCAFVMDDFGNATELTYSVTRISRRDGDA